MFRLRYLASVPSFSTFTKKLWRSGLWSGCKAHSLSHLPAPKWEGLLRFCCPKTSFPPRSFWKQGPLFLPQAIIWLQGWRFWHPKGVQPTATCTQHKHRVPYFCRWFHIYSVVAFRTEIKKTNMQAHCVLLCDRGREGALTWTLTLLWPCLQQTVSNQFVWI